MARDFAKAFYKSKEWRQCRASYIPKVFGLCETIGCREPGYILHHKIPLSPDNINDPYITLNHDNLQFLCLDCHNRIDSKNKPVREDVMFDEYGQLIKR